MDEAEFWISLGQGSRGQGLWSFELFVPGGFNDIEEINWRDLIPPAGA